MTLVHFGHPVLIVSSFAYETDSLIKAGVDTYKQFSSRLALSRGNAPGLAILPLPIYSSAVVSLPFGIDKVASYYAYINLGWHGTFDTMAVSSLVTGSSGIMWFVLSCFRF